MQIRHVHLLLLATSLSALDAFWLSCDKKRLESLVSKQPLPNDGRYYLEVDDGKLENYVPGRKYPVTLKVDIYGHPSSKFKNFFLTMISKATPDDDVTQETGKFSSQNDGLTRFSYTCLNTVIEANILPKTEISVTWIAPPHNSGCVTIKAIVIESKEKWFTDDEFTDSGYLTKTLCESFDEDEDAPPEVLDHCCACDEAKYELAFQGNWIRNNHPKGFPEDVFTTRFSDVIGASHKQGHQFWKVGEKPSQGLKELAYNGSSKTLESELMDNIANLHTIIKARGLAYPNITSSSYAIFRVDNKNHLVSLVTKMMPSPDWIVGVSNFELCLSNCSWKQFRTINLYPRDVGIDNSVSYTENDPIDNPDNVVKDITPLDPADPSAPFYNENGEPIKPIARLHFKLEKVYKKECDPDREPEENAEQPEEENPKEETKEETPPSESVEEARHNRGLHCEIVGWSSWSQCSVKCGKGHATRNVKFKRMPSPGDCPDVAREETQECTAECEAGEQEMHICPHIIWTPWTPCSVSCGTGIKKRLRVQAPVPPEDDDETNKPCTETVNDEEVVECAEKC